MSKRTGAANTNQAQDHVPSKVINVLGDLAERKDSVTTGPVSILLTAGLDTIMSWPTVEEEREKPKKPGEVDWFRAEVDRSAWAQGLVKQIDELKAQPKNAVRDREIQTLRQRPSYAAGILRIARAMASKVRECEGCGFDVTFPDGDAITRTTFPITVIDDKRKGLPVQLNVRDFNNLRVVKGKKATELEVSGGRREKRRKVDAKTLQKAMEGSVVALAAVAGALADTLDNVGEEAVKSKPVVHELKHLRVSVGKALKEAPAKLAMAA